MYSSFIDDIWGADLADVQLTSQFIKGICFYYVLLIFLVNTHGLLLWKTKMALQLLMLFKKILDESNHKPKNLWIDKGSEFYDRSIKSFLQNNDIKMYWTHNEGKSVIAERFITALKKKIYQYMTSISKNVYIDKLDGIVNIYNNTYHRTIKMKPVDVKSSTYFDFNKENIRKILNLKLAIM